MESRVEFLQLDIHAVHGQAHRLLTNVELAVIAVHPLLPDLHEALSAMEYKHIGSGVKFYERVSTTVSVYTGHQKEDQTVKLFCRPPMTGEEHLP